MVLIYLNKTKNEVTIPDMTAAGSYQGSISSIFRGLNVGTYDLTIIACELSSPEIQDRLSRLVMVL